LNFNPKINGTNIVGSLRILTKPLQFTFTNNPQIYMDIIYANELNSTAYNTNLLGIYLVDSSLGGKKLTVETTNKLRQHACYA